mmetsp:Transcript_15939/g.22178  ORF Transcript_15939/g.22178 Transcript_15939/m.22178 type:complete len:369 (-) Transcript_15939:96-1202(-)
MSNENIQIEVVEPEDKRKRSASKSGNKKKDEKQKKAKTFNRLDERFQLQDHHDPEHIFPEEYEMIKVIRDKYPETATYSDKALCMFLCARRHVMEDVFVLVERHLKKRKELKLDTRSATVEEAWKVLKTGQVFKFKHCIDKHERLVIWGKFAAIEPKMTTTEEKLISLYWEVDHVLKTEPLRYIRNGMIMIIDVAGGAMRNLETSKELNEAMTGVLPRRIRKMYVLNGGFLIRMLMQAGKYILPKKLMKRVELLDMDQLRDLVPPEWLLKEYGGQLTLGLDDFYREMKEAEEISLLPGPSQNQSLSGSHENANQEHHGHHHRHHNHHHKHHKHHKDHKDKDHKDKDHKEKEHNNCCKDCLNTSNSSNS